MVDGNDYDEVIIIKPDGTVKGKFSSFGVIRAFHSLNGQGKENVIRSLVEVLRENRAFLEFVTSKKGKPELWMESRLENEMDLTPKRVAYECMFYLGIEKKMMPYLLRLAQRVKHRLRKRLGAQGLYVLNSPARSKKESSLSLKR